MISTPTALNVPLRTDSDGVIRIGNTRVTLLTIIGAYNRHDTPEEIHEGFPTIPLADIHIVIAYYLANKAEVDEYIAQKEQEAEKLRQEIEARNPPITRDTLLARLEAKRKKSE